MNRRTSVSQLWRLGALGILQSEVVWGQTKPLSEAGPGYGGRLTPKRAYPFDLKTGQLGKLRNLFVRSPNLAVVLRSGSQNRAIRTSHPFAIKHLPIEPSDLRLDPDVIDLEISIQGPIPSEGATVVIEIATLRDIVLASPTPNQVLRLDRVAQPELRIYCGSHLIDVNQVAIGKLRLDINGQAQIVACGSVDQLSIGSAQRGSAVYAQNLQVKDKIYIQPLAPHQHYAINVESSREAVYDNPARSIGLDAKRYPLELEGAARKLTIGGGKGADVLPLSNASNQAAIALREHISTRLGKYA